MSSGASFPFDVRVARKLCLIATLSLPLAACEGMGLIAGPDPSYLTGENPADVKYFPSDEPVKLGAQRFHEGNYGLAQQYFQDAVDRAPRDATAWVGLAASYDRLGRYDLADKSYAAAIALVGRTASILNNEGYSYMLRGDLKKARAKLEAARKLAPDNETTINNLKLLNSSAKYVERSADGAPCDSVDCGN